MIASVPKSKMFNKDNTSKVGAKPKQKVHDFNLFEIIKAIVQFIAAQYFAILKIY